MVLCAWRAGLAQTGAGSQNRPPPPEDRVDINHATIDELMRIPGMTHTWASRIVRFRPYRAKNDLLENGVVTSEVYDRIRNYIVAHRGEQ